MSLPAARRAAVTKVILAVVVAAVVALGLSRVGVDTGISSFVPRGDDSYDQLQQRDVDFGADPIVVMLDGTSQNGLLIDHEQLTELVALEGELSRLPDVAVVYGPGTVLNQTAKSVGNVVLQISGARDGVENTASIQGKQKGLSGPGLQAYVDKAIAEFDRRYGSLVSEAMPMGVPSLSNRKFVASVLFDNDGEPRSNWKFLVPSPKSAVLLVRPRADLDQEGIRTLVDRVKTTVDKADLQTDPPTITGVPVVTSAVASTATDEAPRLGVVALVSVGLVLFLVPWTRRRRDRLRPLAVVGLGTATTLAVFGLLDRPMSLGVVAFLPIVLGIGSDFPIYLARHARRRVVLSAAAGAVLGFASLAISPLPFVREFGLALALGVVATLGWAFVLRRWLTGAGGTTPLSSPDDTVGPALARRSLPKAFVAAISLAAVVAAGIGWAVLPTLDVASDPTELAEGLPELADVEKVDQRIGFSSEITLVVRGEKVMTPETLAWAKQVEEKLVTEHGDQLRPLLTLNRLLEFLGEKPTPEEIEAGSTLLPAYLLEAVVGDGGRAGAMTFGVRTDDVARQHELIQQVRSELPAPPPGIEAEWVGLPVVASSGYDAVSASRWTIGLGGLAVAALVVAIGMRSWRTGLMIAGAALIASGWVHLGIFLSDTHLTPLTLAVAALITVTACEFTVILSERTTSGLHLGRAVSVAALAATLGYLTLVVSDLAVLQSFGWVLAFGVSSSCLAAWLVTTSVRTFTANAQGPEQAPATQASSIEREVVPCP